MKLDSLMRGWRPPFWLVLGGAALVGLVAALAWGSGINGTENSSVRVAGLGKSFSFPSTTAAVAAPVAVSDNFNRANSASLGANWTTVTNQLAPKIDTNAAYSSSTDGGYSAAYWSADTFANNQYAQALIAVPSSDSWSGVYTSGVTVRQSAAANTAYALRTYVVSCGLECSDVYLVLDKVVAGTKTEIASEMFMNGGDGSGFSLYVRLEASGTTLTYRFKLNIGDAWTSFSLTDAAIASGSPGISLTSAYFGGIWYQISWVDDWLGGDL